MCVFIVHWSQNAHGYSVFSQVCLRLRVLQQVLWDRPVDRVCCCHSCHVHCQSGGSQSSTNTDVRESSRGSKSLSFHLQVPFTYVDYDSNARLWPAVRQAHEMVDRYQLVNSYGLFRRMTGVGGRPEVVIEGSRDGVTWTVSVATDFTLFFFFGVSCITSLLFFGRRLSLCTSQATSAHPLLWSLLTSPGWTGKCGLLPSGVIHKRRGSPVSWTDCCRENKMVGKILTCSICWHSIIHKYLVMGSCFC